MSEVAVLQPHDCLTPHHRRRRRSHHPSSPPQKVIPSVIPPKLLPHQPRRKRTTPRPVPPPPPSSSKDLVMGQVKILRRGDHLPGSTPQPSEGLLPQPPEEVVQIQGPLVEFIQSKAAQKVNGFYAGSAAFVASPPPSSVPLPGFFAKKGACDSATSELRRMLRLD